MKYTDIDTKAYCLQPIRSSTKKNEQAAVKELTNKLKAKDREYQKLKLEEKSIKFNLKTEKINELIKQNSKLSPNGEFFVTNIIIV